MAPNISSEEMNKLQILKNLPAWKTLLRPAICPKSDMIAIITPELTIHLLSILPGSLVKGLEPPRIISYDLPERLLHSPRSKIQEPTLLRIRQWEDPTTDRHHTSHYWLLLSDDAYIAFICVNLEIRCEIGPNAYSCHAEVKAHTQIPTVIGADFVTAEFFQPPVALLTFAGGPECMLMYLGHNSGKKPRLIGSVAVMTSSQIKETGYQCYAESPDSAHWAFLVQRDCKDPNGSSKSQDRLLVYQRDRTAFDIMDLPTKNAQGIIWCPNGAHYIGV